MPCNYRESAHRTVFDCVAEITESPQHAYSPKPMRMPPAAPSTTMMFATDPDARPQRVREAGVGVAAYIGAGLLASLGHGLVIIGAVLLYMGIVNSADAAHAIDSDERCRLSGGMVPVGIGLAVRLCRRTGGPCIGKSVEDLFGLLLAFRCIFVVQQEGIGTRREGTAVMETFRSALRPRRLLTILQLLCPGIAIRSPSPEEVRNGVPNPVSHHSCGSF